MTETGWTCKQGVQSTFCGNMSVSTDNRLQSAFGERNPSRRRQNRKPEMTGSCLVSVSTDRWPRSESSASHWRNYSERWKGKTPGAWTTTWKTNFFYLELNRVLGQSLVSPIISLDFAREMGNKYRDLLNYVQTAMATQYMR